MGNHGRHHECQASASRSTPTAAAARARFRRASLKTWSARSRTLRRGDPTVRCWSGWTTVTTRRWSRLDGGPAFVATTDFFTPVVDDAYDWGRIAATNALSDVYAMGGRPVVAVNLLGWPRDVLPMELAGEVLRGGLAMARRRAAIWSAATASTTPSPSTAWPSPASSTPTGCCATTRASRAAADADQAARHRRAQHAAQGDRRGVPGGGRRDDDAEPRRRRSPRSTAGVGAPPTSPASACSATCSSWPGRAGSPPSSTRPRCPTSTEPARRSADGYISGGTRRNLDWVRPHATSATVGEADALLLADAQTSGGLLVAGEVPGAPVIGELVPRGEHLVVVR